MSDFNTLRVLSLDGGGMRGLISATFLKLFVQEWGINGNELWKYFDVISGSSIGAIQALGYAFGKNPDDMISLFSAQGPYIFTTSSSSPSVQPSTLSKINTIVGGPLSNPTFYPSTTEGIGQMRLKSALESTFGASTMQSVKTNVLITSFEKNDLETDFTQDTNTPVYFSNSSLVPVLTGQNFLIKDVALASSAAPLYFAPHVIGEDSYIDGGVSQNNPEGIGLAIGKSIKKFANRFCVLSIGTGLGDVGFPTQSNPVMQRVVAKIQAELKLLESNSEAFAEKFSLCRKKLYEVKQVASTLGALEGAYLIMYLLGATIAGPQEVAAKEMEIRAKYTLEKTYTYRMQYYLNPDLDTELDNSSADILNYYTSSVTSYFNDNRQEISNFIARLAA